MSETVGEKRERGLSAMALMMGQAFADNLREFAVSDGFGSAVARMAIEFAFADVWTRGGLSKRDRSLVILGALIAMREPKQLKSHVKIGLINGLTMREIEEVLVQATPYVGLPASANAMTAMIEALREVDDEAMTGTEEDNKPF